MPEKLKSPGRCAMRNAGMTALAFAALSATTFAADLSTYRNFSFGADLPAIAKQTDMTVAQASIVSQRSGALIQQLQWRPQPLGWSAKTEAVRMVQFGFYNGELFRIAVDYDVHETEGLTVNDMVEAVSASYGVAERSSAPAVVAQDSDRDEPQDVLLARWQDPQYRYDLVRSPYGEGFRLIGVLKRLEAPARAATLEAKRLDDLEAPQRNAAKAASDEAAEKARLEKTRLVNKPAFRP